MNDVEELREFALVHARTQQIPPVRYTEVLHRITHDGDGDGSWVGEWSAAAAATAAGGDLLTASRLYTMARFPYVDGEPRQRAQDEARAVFERWRTENAPELRPLTVQSPDGPVHAFSTGGPADRGRPFVILMGGIISTKEQWAPTLLRLGRLGIRGVVTELPGISTGRYRPDSWQLLPQLLDAVADRADTRRTYAMTMSFSGQLGLRAALADRRIKGVATVGAPLHHAFTDTAWQQRSWPRITVDTLAHLTGTDAAKVGAHLADWALTPEQLAAVDVPVAYVASRRDEVIPAEDINLLRRQVRALELLEFDDVHASPRHVGVTAPWLAGAVLRMHGAPPPQRLVLRAVVAAQRAKAALERRTR
ncbi:alpha/beta hydrolase [Streptomyces sp. NPDC020983]|uniref:alpha/beta hydrolase n=1 Tax=Streptomyces sp. NPDC020983 TaxID=3365106 RepID=UPI0037926BAA